MRMLLILLMLPSVQVCVKAQSADSILAKKNVFLTRDSLQYYLQLGYSKLRSMNVVGAMEEYSKAIKVAPDSAVGYVHRAVLRMKCKDYPKAISDLSAALLIDSTNTVLIMERGKLLLALGAPENALPDFTTVVEREPQDWLAYYYRALCFTKLLKDEAAVEDLTKSLSIAQTADAYFQRGKIKARYSKYADALHDYDEALTKNENHIEALSERAQLNLKIGREKDALQDALKAKIRGDEKADDILKRLVDIKPANDSLRTYFTTEIVVTATREEYIKALQETKRLSVEATNVLAMSPGTVGNTALHPTIKAIQGRTPDECRRQMKMQFTSEKSVDCFITLMREQAKALKNPKIYQLLAEMEGISHEAAIEAALMTGSIGREKGIIGRQIPSGTEFSARLKDVFNELQQVLSASINSTNVVQVK